MLTDDIVKLSNTYDDIAGVVATEDSITEAVTSTDLLFRIGLIKEVLIKIRDEGVNQQSAELYNAIRYVLEINPCDSEYSEQQYCSCGGLMIYEKKYLRCSQCDGIKYNNTDNFNIDIPNSGDNIARNNNIVKHLNKNLSYIYGENLPDKLPEKVVEKICDEIKSQLPYLTEAVHYSYEVHELLQNMPLIIHEGSIYKPKDYKTFTNAFILHAYPEIIIPKLKPEDLNLVSSVFLETTSEYLNYVSKNTEGKINKYNNNYQFTIHRIIYMLLHHVKEAKELLRFVYIQRPASFEHKDKKLRKVNDRIHCFEYFWDTPMDIYINDRYY
jgi:hypothetical protein